MSEREALKDTAREFVRREVVPHLAAWEDAEEVPRDLHARLVRALGEHDVLTDPELTASYETDWTRRFRGRACAVVRPRSTEQVAEVLRACAASRVPVVPQGGNTSLCEGAIPRSGEPASVVISLQRMRRVRSIDAANNSIEVDAGCVLAQVQH